MHADYGKRCLVLHSSKSRLALQLVLHPAAWTRLTMILSGQIYGWLAWLGSKSSKPTVYAGWMESLINYITSPTRTLSDKQPSSSALPLTQSPHFPNLGAHISNFYNHLSVAPNPLSNINPSHGQFGMEPLRAHPPSRAGRQSLGREALSRPQRGLPGLRGRL
jgi:hypothetical protein